MPEPTAQPVRVFISYSWDSDEHRQRVLELAQRLRRNGIDAWIDRFTPFPPEGWQRWMKDEIDRAKFVLVVATKNYAERFAGKAPEGTGLGVNRESSIISTKLYDAGGFNEKFLPTAFSQADMAHIPDELRPYTRFCLDTDAGYTELYRILADQPAVVPVALGAKLDLSAPAAAPQLPALEIPVIHNHAARHSNLPRLPFGFFGREQELADIAEALAPGARTWGALIDGPGGMGKTSLAIRAAELTPPGQFDRIIFVTAKKRELTPDGAKRLADFSVPDYLTMLNEVARELGLKDFARTPEAERPRELQSALQKARVLLIFDNLETLTEDDRDKLNNFLNHLPGDCKALITSRRRMEAFASIVRLGSLEEDAAFGLIQELAKKNNLLKTASEAQRHALFVNTGGNPLLLRWVAGQLGRGGCKTTADALKLLHAAQTKNDPLEFVFGDLAVEFTEDETRVLAALSHFNTLVEVQFIAALAGLEEAAAQAALDSLTSRALVNCDAEAARYVMTPLVAPYLKRARPEAVKLTGDNLCGWADTTAIANGRENHARFPNLEAVWPQLAAALPLLLEGDNARLQTVCEALHSFMEFSGHWDEWVAFFRQAEEKAVAAKDFYNAGWRAYQIGYAYSLLHQSVEVIEYAGRAEKYWRADPANVREQPAAIVLRGQGCVIAKDYPSAITAFSQAIELYRGLKQADKIQSKNLAVTLNELANAQRRDGKLDDAEKNYREALEIAGKIPHAESIAAFTGNLVVLALDRKDWTQAEKLAREVLPLVEKLQRKQLIASNNGRLAKALAKLDRKADGLPYARKSVEIYTELHSPDLAWAQGVLKECQP